VGVVESGERLPDRPGVQVVLLADTEGLCSTHVRYAGDAPETPLHVHRLHDDCFLILDGVLRLHLADGERLVEAESWVHVPRGVVHGFSVASDEVTFVNFHTPASGFGPYIRALTAQDDEQLRSAREGFDQHPAPPENGGASGDPIVCSLGGGEGETVINRPSRRVTILGDTEQLGVTESVYGAGERGPDLHVHREHTDAWLVLEGALMFRLRDGQSFRAEAGTLVVVPPNVAHGFANEEDVPARFLNLHAPSCGFADYMRGQNPAFDQHPLPADGGLDPGAVVARTLRD
jgi:quercetin dioxygenase-like cupin family protein